MKVLGLVLALGLVGCTLSPTTNYNYCKDPSQASAQQTNTPNQKSSNKEAR